MSNYTYMIQFSDPALGKPPIVVPEYHTEGPTSPINGALYPGNGEFNSITASTSLLLVGKGVPTYGELIQKNLIHLLENFASNGTEPVNSTIGQTWYDSSTRTLKLRTQNITNDPVWSRVITETGGTLTGILTLSADPVGNLDAVTKQYVDNNTTSSHSGLTNLSNDDHTQYALANGTRGAFASLSHVTDFSVHLTGAQNSLLDGISASAGEINNLVGSLSPIQLQLNEKVNVSGGTMTGLLTLSGAPASALHAATKQYVDGGLSVKSNTTHNHTLDSLSNVITSLKNDGDTLIWNSASNKWINTPMPSGGGTSDGVVIGGSIDDITGILTLSRSIGGSVSIINIAPFNHNHVSNSITHTIDVLSTYEDVFNTHGSYPLIPLDEVINATASKLYVDTLVSSSLSQITADGLYVDVTGDTMTGALTLSGDPTANLHAATKQYVDIGLSGKANSSHTHDATYVNVTGDTMTGALTLSGAPTANLHAATKQYVDDQSSTMNVTRSLVTSTGQSIFTTPTYVIGSNTLWVFVQGQKAYEGVSESYTETTTTSVTFTYTVPAGAKVEFLVFGA